MSKQLLALLTLVLLVALVAPALPVRAQDGGDEEEFPFPSLPPCTAEEQQQLSTIMNDFVEQLGQISDPSSLETGDEFAAFALTINDFRTQEDEDDTATPMCADAMVALSSAEFLLDNYVITMQLGAISIYAAEAGDTDLVAEMQAHGDKTTEYMDNMTEIITTMSAGTLLLEESLPLCTEADLTNEAYTQLLALEPKLDDPTDVLNAYLADSTVTTDGLSAVSVALQSWETLTTDMPLCNEIFWRELTLGSLYYDAMIAMNWSLLTQYAQGDLNTSITTTLATANEDLASDYQDWQDMFGTAETAE